MKNLQVVLHDNKWTMFHGLPAIALIPTNLGGSNRKPRALVINLNNDERKWRGMQVVNNLLHILKEAGKSNLLLVQQSLPNRASEYPTLHANAHMMVTQWHP